MPVISSLALSTAASFGSSLAYAVRRFGRGALRVIKKIQHRRAATILARFDDRMLADIGLTRADLRDAYAGRLWDDPTHLLRSRALERRLARHGISHGLSIERAVAPPLAPKVDVGAIAQARAAYCKCN